MPDTKSSSLRKSTLRKRKDTVESVAEEPKKKPSFSRGHIQ